MAADGTSEIGGQMKAYLKILGVLSIVLFAIIPFQAAIYFIAPPPTDVVGFLDLYRKNPLLGFIDFDLNLTIDNILFLLVYIGLFVLLRKSNPVLALIGFVFAIISVTLYVVSREALFGMLALSDQYIKASGEADKASIITNGKMLMTIFNGTCFNVSYTFGGIALTVFSVAMLNSALFSRAIGFLGVLVGLLMLVPPTAGKIGFALSFISLLPLMPWLIMLAAGFFRLRKNAENLAGAGTEV